MNIKKEDQASVTAIESGKVGKPTFIRYSLSISNQEKNKKDALLDEIFGWIRSLAKLEMERLSATYSQNKEVLLISMQFIDSTIANLSLNFSRKDSDYIKNFEIAGTKGIYVFDSEQNQGFQSNCCHMEAYQIEKNTGENTDWLNLVHKSLLEHQLVYKGVE